MRGSLFHGEGNSKFKIQNSELMDGKPGILGIFPIRAAACGGPHEADLLQIEASSQSGERACDTKEQPSARGRLRAAGRCATDFQFGPQPAEGHTKQTCGTRAAGLRRREAAARTVLTDRS